MYGILCAVILRQATAYACAVYDEVFCFAYVLAKDDTGSVQPLLAYVFLRRSSHALLPKSRERNCPALLRSPLLGFLIAYGPYCRGSTRLSGMLLLHGDTRRARYDSKR